MDYLFVLMQSRKKMGKLIFVYAKKQSVKLVFCAVLERKNLVPKY